MARRLIFLGIGAVLPIALALADIDLSDFDTVVMDIMDQTVKDLEPHIGARDLAAAKDDAQVLLEGLKETAAYFAGKANASGAEALAREGQEHAAAVLRALDAGDFDKAADAARAISRTCRKCHDRYRP